MLFWDQNFPKRMMFGLVWVWVFQIQVGLTFAGKMTIGLTFQRTMQLNWREKNAKMRISFLIMKVLSQIKAISGLE